MTLEDRERGLLPVRGRTLRFAVGSSDGLSSDSWVVTTNKHGDIHISCRDGATDSKVSIHASGRCRLAYTQHAARERGLATQGEDRVVEKWERSVEWGRRPVRLFQIIVPHGSLYRDTHYRSRWSKKMVFVAPHERDDAAAYMSIWGVPHGMGIPDVDEAGYLAVLDLTEGMSIQVVAWYHAGVSGSESMAAIGSAIIESMESEQLEVPDPVAILYGSSPDGSRMLMMVPLKAWRVAAD